MLQINAKLKALIAKLWDRFWSGGISNPLSAIEQITYLLFMKQIDELDLKREQDAEFTGDTYTSRFSGDYFLPNDRSRIEEMSKPKAGESAAQKKAREAEVKSERKRLAIDKATLRWSHFRQMKADEMLPHVQQKVFPFIKELNGDGSNFAKHMANAVFIIPSANLLQGAVQIIEEIFVEIELDAREQGHLFQDIQGDVYEMLLNEISSAGKNGQFRTPRHIIKLISELVNPQLGHRICDPACGTAGFLLDAYQYIVTQLARKKVKKQKFEPDEDGFIRTSVSGQLDQNKKDILEQSLYGFDFDSTMVRLALMNLMMHGIDNPHVDYQDTLSKSFTEEMEYDIVMANPPFTGSIDKGDINEGLTLKTTKTELLFTERIFTLLKKGGTAGIIVPQGVLFGAAGAFVEARKKLVEEAELKAVISLPSGVFKPYAGVATAILVFTRSGKTQHTWFYNLANDGMTLDDRRTRVDGSELPDVVEKWNARNPKEKGDRKSNCFFVPVEEIREKTYDLSFNRYGEVEHDETEHEDPKSLLQQLKALEDKIQQGISELQEILG
ncbi:N-6 DNA methylase [Pirellula staleyi DSM 6068]|uniref:site-specific DNA-methyltransferase (adenine-specific) n=1 Tax=Pirellula staleyi (strain ATCC 27377 / DSM 6068 / ICPB 4128) TaxID=530564 RepID=D2R602_PIRSD|nr:type I restriction-modification system subunit M [Pirellula staleyi]ADB19087.1 N-6 DNA methylase [Pirellula staleyi DSM 6068]